MLPAMLLSCIPDRDMWIWS